MFALVMAYYFIELFSALRCQAQLNIKEIYSDSGRCKFSIPLATKDTSEWTTYEIDAEILFAEKWKENMYIGGGFEWKKTAVRNRIED